MGAVVCVFKGPPESRIMRTPSLALGTSFLMYWTWGRGTCEMLGYTNLPMAMAMLHSEGLNIGLRTCQGREAPRKDRHELNPVFWAELRVASGLCYCLHIDDFRYLYRSLLIDDLSSRMLLLGCMSCHPNCLRNLDNLLHVPWGIFEAAKSQSAQPRAPRICVCVYVCMIMHAYMHFHNTNNRTVCIHTTWR